MSEPATVQESEAKLRVALLIPSLWMGGATVFCLNLGRELLRRGIAAEVFATDVADSMQEDFRRGGVPVSQVRREGLIFEDKIITILAEMRRFAPTAVIASVGFDMCELLRYLPAGVVRVGVVHAAQPAVFAYADRYEPWIDRLVSVSAAFEPSLKASVRKFSADRITSIEMGVPVLDMESKPVLDSARPLHILYLGRLEEGAKRVRLFPQIFRDLCAAKIPFRWTIAGIGPEQPFLQSHLESRLGQEVRFVGLVPYTEVPKLLRDHDVMLLTSDSETFCLSLHEGMAAGLVPVASALPGRVGEIVTPQTGCAIPIDQIDGYAKAIVWLHHHRTEMQAMSRASRKMINEAYSVPAMADRWMSFLQPLVPVRAPVWPESWKIRPPCGRKWALRYHPIWRFLRRGAARIRYLLNSRRT